jgi:poly(rC)-binding protein 2/3/4
MSGPEMPGETPAVTLTLRMLMSGKEVGPIIGKGGEIINSIREEAGAKIHISDGACPERVITVTGATDAIFKAYSLICRKLEDEEAVRAERRGEEREEETTARREGLSLRLVIPASQCGSLIGKGGSKIKEIREVTGCSVQVASEPLPGSSERMVTVVGSRDAVTQCVYHVCCVFLESPAKGTTVQYQPGRGASFGPGPMARGGEGRGPPHPLAGLLGLGEGSSTLAAIASIAGSQIRRHEMRNREERGIGAGIEGREATFAMSVPNELIGSVIGKGGSKIAEIRQMSGAMIRINRSDDPATAADEERQINISGNPDSVALAKSLINMSLDLHKVRALSEW